MLISIFGGSAPFPRSPAYEEAYQLGALLAHAGHTVATGGYLGVMEAASRGAAEAGGHVIGVTTGALENAPNLRVNAWVKEAIPFPTLRERLYHLTSLCDVAIALAGGVGTLAEIAFLWNLMQIAELPPRPLIAVGPVWAATLHTFLTTADPYLKPRDKTLIQCVPTVEDAVAKVAVIG
jgi:hypothetical protein